jgi:hypothetical protein
VFGSTLPVYSPLLLGSISPNFFAKQKVASERRSAKNLKFNFINKVVRLKNSVKICQNMYAICQTPFDKKVVKSCVREKNSRANVGEIDP